MNKRGDIHMAPFWNNKKIGQLNDFKVFWSNTI